MSTKVKVTQIGNSLGVILPKEVLDGLNVQKGDELHLFTERGELRLSPFDPEFDEQMRVARDVMRRRRNVLRKLAE